MATDLIDAYLRALRTRLAWRDDVQDVVDEAADHLYEHAARLVTQGVSSRDAERLTLQRFGDVGLVARAFAQTASGALAVPTRFTRRAGYAGVAAAGAWALAVVLAAVGGHTGLLVPWSLRVYVAWVTVLALALTLTTAMLVGVLARTGRLSTRRGRIALGLGVLATLSMAVFGWAITVVAAVYAVGILMTRSGGAHAAPRLARPLLLLAVWPIGALAVTVLDRYPVGPVDEYGDHPSVWLGAFTICALITALAVGRVGLLLRGEPVADIDGDPSDRRHRLAPSGA